MKSVVQIQGEFTFKGQRSTEHPDLVNQSTVVRDESHQQTPETVREFQRNTKCGELDFAQPSLIPIAVVRVCASQRVGGCRHGIIFYVPLLASRCPQCHYLWKTEPMGGPLGEQSG